MTHRMTFRAACVQLRSSNVVAENIDAAERLIREAAGAGADYVQTPEMTNIVERNRASLAGRIRSEDEDPAAARFAALAKELRIVLHIGSLALKASTGSHREPRPALRARRKPACPLRQDPSFRRRSAGRGELAGIGGLSTGRSGRRRRPSVAAAWSCHLLRSPLSAPLSRAGACRRGGADCPGRLHPADGRSALACAAAGARHRERRVRHIRRAGGASCRRPRDLRAFPDRFALGGGTG